MKALDRRRLLTSGAAAAVLAASSLGAGAGPARGGVLRLGLSGAHKSDRFYGGMPFGAFMMVAGVGCAFETLTEVLADGTLSSELADAWEPIGDGASWLLSLRRGVAFHEGRELSADDVVFSLKRHSALRPDLLPNVDGIRKTDRLTVRVDLAAADPGFPMRLANPNLIIHPAKDWQNALTRGLGTGLYRLDQFEAGHRFSASRVTSHWKGEHAGWFDRVVGIAISAPAHRITALARGDVDAIDAPGPALVSMGRLSTLVEHHAQIEAAHFAASAKLAQGPAVGRYAPLDNFRLPERWWFG